MVLALEGLRVVEWGRGRMAAYAGKLLAEFGAGVTLLVEPNHERERALFGQMSEPEREALSEFLDARKSEVRADPYSDPRQLYELLADADVLLLEHYVPRLDAAGLSPESLAEQFPETVVVACTLGGLTPLGRNLRHSDLVAHAIGGIASRTPARHPNHLDEPPLKIGGYQADYCTGLVAASSALVALQQRRRGATKLLCDVSAQAALSSFMRWEAGFALYNCPLAEPPRRTTFSSLVPCKDGFFAFQVSEQHQWEGLKAMMGNPEWARDPKFEIITDGVANWEEFEPGFLEWTRRHTKYEILQIGQSLRVPVFPLNDTAELQRDPQQQFRKFFRPTSVAGAAGPVMVPGAPVHLRETPALNDPGTSWLEDADE